jgi:spore maturation protein A
MGIIQVAIDAGLIDALARVCKPLIRFLFGEQSDEVNALLATNISANMIGAGNAATPAAIDAIEKMSTPTMKKATTPMIMLFILSATSMQILPTTVLGILEEAGATNAAGTILPTIITSTLITVIGVILVKVLGARRARGALCD